jgi:glutamate dehydrogenase
MRSGDAATVLERAELVERAIADVLEGAPRTTRSTSCSSPPASAARRGAVPRLVPLPAPDRPLLQPDDAVDALRRAPTSPQGSSPVRRAHDPRRAARARSAERPRRRSASLAQVAAIDEDRILRLFHGVISATLRTNAFSPAGEEALAFKLDSAKVPGLPKPLPWREIWVYSPRVEGIHLRGGPIARGGLRWSDRRDDFRTEILGLMKAQLVKNAVIVPTGAKGGFYPKHLPPVSDRDAWLAEGTESYRVFIRALLSVTDNIVENKVVPPEQVRVLDGDDPYFVVAADKGTATFSDCRQRIALERGFWLGDAFASGGSQGYDHKAMGITAQGRLGVRAAPLREMGVDVQTAADPVTGVGDMSGDVFGNGMLLSKAIKLVAAFDHRPHLHRSRSRSGESWEERADVRAAALELGRLRRSLISAGGGIFPRSQKTIPLSPEIRALLRPRRRRDRTQPR